MAFRFESLEVWQQSADLSRQLFVIAAGLEERKQFRWAEQLRASTLSITNNIAEGSGSFSKAEFAQFLNFARRSAFETANILILLAREQSLAVPHQSLLNELDEISRMITAFRKTLL
ncbi:four helix bundle protein [Luteolibacter luteus]|uniref:Four helix bundle protein n=1 Tax=Luteolibacter luteus TaxID=2728835 RepID=A0A858RJD6_9BACT|nr:four helix bundle protein [Luteolibacter luteus]QJE96952.1 four helix bundle protein [Luteolibacter luteus]